MKQFFTAYILFMVNLLVLNIFSPIYGVQDILQRAYEGNVREVHTLLENGANVNTVNCFGDTVLMRAIKGKTEGCLFVVKELLKHPFLDVINNANGKGRTALMLAIRRNKCAVAELLLKDSEIDVCKEDKSGNSALDYARINLAILKAANQAGGENKIDAYKELIALLEQRLTDVGSSIDDDWQKLHMFSAERMALGLLKLGKKSPDDTLVYALQEGWISVTDKALKRGADVNYQNDSLLSFGVTPLMIALKSSEAIKLAGMLLERPGIDISKNTYCGESALSIVQGWPSGLGRDMMLNRLNAMLQLQTCGVSFNITSELAAITIIHSDTDTYKGTLDYNKMLLGAAGKGWLGAVQAALIKGADINYQDDVLYNTPLISACINNDGFIIQELLQYRNIDLCQPNWAGDTAQSITERDVTPSYCKVKLQRFIEQREPSDGES